MLNKIKSLIELLDSRITVSHLYRFQQFTLIFLMGFLTNSCLIRLEGSKPFVIYIHF